MYVSNDLQVGKAGEYLVCFDLIMKGFICYPSEQGLPYDLLLDTGEKLLKVQVKTTREPRTIPQRTNDYKSYLYQIRRMGKGGRKHYQENEVDIFALVALDTRSVGYLKGSEAPMSLCLRCDEYKGSYGDEQWGKDYERIIALKGKMTYQQIADKLGYSRAKVEKLCNPNYKPHKTKSLYFSDIERQADWFKTV